MVGMFGVLGSPARAVAPLPPEFEGVDVRNLLGQQIDLDLPFVDHEGRRLSLLEYFDGERPVVLTLNFYRCDSLCSAQLNQLLDAVARSGWLPGDEAYRMLTISFDPTDDAELAGDKRQTYLRELARRSLRSADGDAPDSEIEALMGRLDWSFLVGDERPIRALVDRMGYAFNYDERSRQYAHAPVVYLMSPTGRINRYIFGITYNPRDLRFGIMEASEGRLGSFGDKLLLSCFTFDPDGGGYHAFAWGFMRIGGGLVVVVLGTWLLAYWRRERRNKRQLARRAPLPSHPLPAGSEPTS